jgi:trehalose/maltose hydrolase-like predicted phosphorylase
MDNPHFGGLKYGVTPLNYTGGITFRTEIDGDIINDGIDRYRQLNQQHLKPGQEGFENGISFLSVQTTQSGIEIATASKTTYLLNDIPVQPEVEDHTAPAKTGLDIQIDLKENQKFTIEKVVSIYSSQDWDSKEPLQAAKKSLEKVPDFTALLDQSATEWKSIWDKIDIHIEGDRLAQKVLRMHLYHLMVSFSPHNETIDASITARGLHGEAYRGHIFWDELFILPLYTIHFPGVARSALHYRYRRLDAARKYAGEFGYSGAMFPWQSGSDGREETQVVHLNPLTGKWGPDFSSLQRHVSLAIAYNIWQYFHSTNDKQYMINEGAEMFLEICRFWASKAVLNTKTGRYSIKKVMGPDEFHEKYPGSHEGGLNDNTYTNLMVVWSIDKAFELFDLFGNDLADQLKVKLKLSDDELIKWQDIRSKMNVVIQDNILAQYDGYFDLEELDWNYYRETYGNIYRMDRLLKSEGKLADDYKVAKQADTLQTFYNLSEDTVSGILKELGYILSKDYLTKNLQYYLARTSHGSTLSKVVHAQLANMIDQKKLSWELYSDALTSDFADIQGGPTGEGIHAGVMAGTLLIALQSYAGLSLKGDLVKFDPHLPGHWRSISFGFTFKSIDYSCTVHKNLLEIIQNNNQSLDATIEVQGKRHILKRKEQYKIQTKN